MKRSVPILDFETSRKFERSILNGIEENEYAAMQKVGHAIAGFIAEDLTLLRPKPKSLSILILAGKGHNAGDAFIALEELSHRCSVDKVDVLLTSSIEELRPLARRALESITCPFRYLELESDVLNHGSFDLCIDGLLGLGCSGGLREPVRSVLEALSTNENIRFRAAVDVPTGLSLHSADIVFKADATYMCGIPKKILFEDIAIPYRGRLRFVDIGFFEQAEFSDVVECELLRPNILDALSVVRRCDTDKRNYGHLVIWAGSYEMPGAMLMSILGALKSGVGLITVLSPHEGIKMLSSTVPEVMWVPLVMKDDRSLDVEASTDRIRNALDRATVFMVGPGLRVNEAMDRVVRSLLLEFPLPVVMDASALQKNICDVLPERAPESPKVLMTPHMGELQRIMGVEGTITPEQVKVYARKCNAYIYVKGSVGYLTDGERVIYMPYGSPVLARGGSGDILAGLMSGIYATQEDLPLTTLCQATVWHALAAQLMVKSQGERAVRTTDLLDYLTLVLRG